MIEPVYDNTGTILLLRIDGVPYTVDALRERLAWAERRRESNRLASQRYEDKVGRAQRNAQRAARKRGKKAEILG